MQGRVVNKRNPTRHFFRGWLDLRSFKDLNNVGNDLPHDGLIASRRWRPKINVDKFAERNIKGFADAHHPFEGKFALPLLQPAHLHSRRFDQLGQLARGKPFGLPKFFDSVLHTQSIPSIDAKRL